MKTNLFLSILAVSTQVSVVAFADQATDRISGPVTCQAGDDATATISANRGDGTGEFTVVDGDGKSRSHQWASVGVCMSSTNTPPMSLG